MAIMLPDYSSWSMQLPKVMEGMQRKLNEVTGTSDASTSATAGGKTGKEGEAGAEQSVLRTPPLSLPPGLPMNAIVIPIGGEDDASSSSSNSAAASTSGSQQQPQADGKPPGMVPASSWGTRPGAPAGGPGGGFKLPSPRLLKDAAHLSQVRGLARG